MLSYNVRSLRDDVAALGRVVRHCRPDVLVAQEAPRTLRWRSRCAALARECELLYAAGGRTAGGNLLLVAPRISVHDVREVRFPQPWREPIRGTVAARLGLGPARFWVAGCHLGLRQGRRVAEARRVGAIVGGAAGSEEPTLVAGDLNETPEGQAWQVLTSFGFSDPLEGAAEPATFPARAPTARADAVLPSEDWAVREFGVPDSPSLRADLRRASDHLPVLAVLALP